MENNSYVSDLNDSHRWNNDIHYRHYLDFDGDPVVICVQDFDYPDYKAKRFLSGDAWDNQVEAKYALKYRYFVADKQKILNMLEEMREEYPMVQRWVVETVIERIRAMD